MCRVLTISRALHTGPSRVVLSMESDSVVFYYSVVNFQKSFRNPKPYWSWRNYGSTPSICTEIRPPFVLLDLPGFYALKKGKPNSTPPIFTAVRLPFVRQEGNPTVHLPFVLQYAFHLYSSTPPICTAVLLRKYWGLGSPESSWNLLRIVIHYSQYSKSEQDVVIHSWKCSESLHFLYRFTRFWVVNHYA